MMTFEPPSLSLQSKPRKTAIPLAIEIRESVTLDVLIAYEDVSAGHRAIQAVRNLAREVSPPIVLSPSLWRFDLLEHPQCRGEAGADADRARLFVISTSTLSKVPATIDGWVSACLAQKLGVTSAVVALLGPLDDWTITIQDEHGFRTAAAAHGRF